MGNKSELMEALQIEQAIYLMRGRRVMFDRDLAAMYSVTTGNLNKAVRRNRHPSFVADARRLKLLKNFKWSLLTSAVTAGKTEASRFQIGSLKKRLYFKNG